MDHLESARRVLRLEIDELKRLADRVDGSFADAVEALKAGVEQKGKIVILGVGKSGNIGHKIAATLSSTEAPSIVLNAQDALHGDLGVVSDGDVVLALSYSGETSEILGLLPYIRRFNVTIICLTGVPSSRLATNSDIVLDTNVQREACPLNLAPTSSSTVMLALGDALAMVLLEARGFKEEDFARLHPGGQLGTKLLTRVSNIMRQGEDLPRVTKTASVSEALSEMTKRRAGATIVLNDDEGGTLAGIFTHGDFARAFLSDPNLASRLVVDYMTKDPVSIHGEKLAVEALNLLGKHRIDDLVVLNESNQPIGLVDTQDLSRSKLF